MRHGLSRRCVKGARRSHSILIVEDDPPTRERLAQAVEAHSELRVIAACGSLSEAVAFTRVHQPEVVLLDLGLPDGSGLELIHVVSRENLPTEVIIAMVIGDESHVVAAIVAGATGFLVKDGELGYIGDAVMGLFAGGFAISSSIAHRERRGFQPATPLGRETAARSCDARLTRRETEVLELVAKGCSYAETAYSLGMSIHTLTSHIKNLYRKLAVRSRGEAVFEGAQLGLIRIGSDLQSHLQP
jgi:DNA-binding NarL/FixJ family response regulator